MSIIFRLILVFQVNVWLISPLLSSIDEVYIEMTCKHFMSSSCQFQMCVRYSVIPFFKMGRSQMVGGSATHTVWAIYIYQSVCVQSCWTLCTCKHLLVCVVWNSCLCVCAYCMSPCSFSHRRPFNVLNEVPWKGWREGWWSECTWAVCACLCSPCFSPLLPFEWWPYHGPSVQLAVSQHGRLLRQTCGGQMLCFRLDLLLVLSPGFPNPTQGTSSWLVRLHELRTFHATLHTLPKGPLPSGVLVNHPASRSQTRKRLWVNVEGGYEGGGSGARRGMLRNPLVPTSLKSNKTGGHLSLFLQTYTSRFSVALFPLLSASDHIS